MNTVFLLETLTDSGDWIIYGVFKTRESAFIYAEKLFKKKSYYISEFDVNE